MHFYTNDPSKILFKEIIIIIIESVRFAWVLEFVE